MTEIFFCYNKTFFNITKCSYLIYKIFQFGARSYIAFVGEDTYSSGFVNIESPNIRNPQEQINAPRRPFLTAILSFGDIGDLCYKHSKNLTFIENYLKLNNAREKMNIGFYETDWTLLIFDWNNITIAINGRDDVYNVSMLTC